ncbi:Spc24 subunit of Ndc80-domain-containing protein [Circinella umbellata]|nr:Spc24 subunit of Ndc80-domain-containing protein [Circinella umbellata]
MTPRQFENIENLLEQLKLETTAFRSSTVDQEIRENLKSAKTRLNDLSKNEPEEVQDPITLEKEKRLAQLKTEWETIKTGPETSKWMSLTDEKAQLIKEIQEHNQEIQGMDDEIIRLQQELSELDHEGDEQEADKVSLQLAVYRGLGVQMVSKDKKCVAALLNNANHHKVDSFDLNKGYSRSFTANHIWEFISK